MNFFGSTTPTPAPGGLSSDGATPAPAPSSSSGGFSVDMLPLRPSPLRHSHPCLSPTYTSTPAPAPAGGFAPSAPMTTGGFGTAPAGAFGAGATTGGFGTVPAGAFGAGAFGAGATTGGFGTAPAGAFRASALASVTSWQGVTPETRYDQLPEAARNCIDQLAAEIKRQRAIADEVRRASPNHGLELREQIGHLRTELMNLGNELEFQNVSLRDMKADTSRLVNQAEVHGTFVVHRMTSRSGLKTIEQRPSEYMVELVASFEERLRVCAQEIEAMRQHLSDEPPPYGQRTRGTTERIASVIHGHYHIFKQLAGLIATTHEQIEALRQSFKERFKHDPFEAAERQERAAERRFEQQIRDQAPPQAAPAPPVPATFQPPAQGSAIFGTPTQASAAPFGIHPPAPLGFDASAQASYSMTPAATPAGGLFSPPAPTPAGGLFATPAAAAPAPAGCFFAAPAPAPTGFIFAAPAPAPTGFIFAAPAPAPAPLTGGLFAAKAPAPSTRTSAKKKSKGRNSSRRSGH